ncbi:ABC transporter permease [Corynebacterium sp. sy017]|uniref:FtsX-like permease family protein n=1 Tax=unclassified Corynebacterium TaxID=2624378 RepID=UPI001185EE47|nr:MULTISPECIES: FtsX-like permease family protein [unclassified Corynebacterium]MBP3089148.1 ABC transporter permease [Corynebacterium sp. sy017]QDZ42503.1 FtsX-like permease family protein [Corynebacterium sp. sy039]TSD91460.1 ABC transporter permease [Corynebacterium sp. SY003]
MKTAQLVWDLQKASIRNREGTGLINIFAIVSMIVSAFFSFIVVGGTWMFYQRMNHPEAASAAMKQMWAEDPKDARIFLAIFLWLAVIACSFLFPAIFSLTAQSAVLGASARERRLAVLRLVGLSATDITAMALIEAAIQSFIGIFLGFLLSVVSLPLFTKLSFQGKNISVSEMLLPWWGDVSVAVILMLLSVVASFIGIQRVRVTPLGVAKREIPAAMKAWRLFVFIALIVIVFVVLNSISIGRPSAWAMMIFFLMLLINALGINLVVPFILQFLAYLASFLPGTAHFIACRRISANARLVWRRSSALAFFGVLSGYMVGSPLGDGNISDLLGEDNTSGRIMFGDINTGILLTLAFGFTISAVSIFLGQANDIFEQAELSRSLQLIGMRKSLQSAIAYANIMGPIIVVSLFGFCIGALLSVAIFSNSMGTDDFHLQLINAGVLLGLGWLTTFCAVLATQPLRNRVLRKMDRKE